MTSVHVAIVQEPPAILDLTEGVDRATEHVRSAAAKGAQLIAFPETWLTGYPAWVFGLSGWDDPQARELYKTLVSQSPSIDSPALSPLREAAARCHVTVVLGLNERKGRNSGTLYNSLLTLGPGGETLNVHRKLIPTHTERIVWAASPDAQGLRACDTQAGRVGALICWEHWQPLIRQALHDQGEQIHVAAWPDMTEPHLVASQAYAFEGRCFVLAAAQFLRAEDVPDTVRDAFRVGVGPQTPEGGVWFPGGSGVVGPDGRWITKPLMGTPGIVHASVDLDQTIAYKHDLDVAGHYARPDIFTLTVDRRRREAVAWVDEVRTDQSIESTDAKDES